MPNQIGTDGLDDPPSWEKVVNPKGRDKQDEDDDQIFSLKRDAKGKKAYGGTLSWHASGGAAETHTDGLIATETVKLLEANKDRPFFLACGFFRPHTPYVAPRELFARFPADKFPLPDRTEPRQPAPAYGSSHPEQDTMSDAQRREVLQAYHASTALMDSQLGVVLAALDRLKLADKTVVVFLSDHGYHLGEHGLWQKMSLFENSARVPLVVHDPRQPGTGRVCGRTVELVDLHATLAGLCGLTAPATDGRSLEPLLADPAAAWDKPAVTQVKRGPKGATGYTVRDERYRYTEWNGGSPQLFDYQSDPAERTNRAADPAAAEVVARLRAKLPRK